MGPLLIVVVIGCALAGAVHIGRGFWARARSVERHHHALNTLADITQHPDVVPRGTGPAPRGPEHQAHVRIIGAEGPSSAPAVLPPPRRAFAAGRPSPFRKPSRSEPSLAALDAIATSPTLRNPRGPAADDDRTLPGIVPPASPVPLDERATRPVPVAKSQVFYFDDLGARSGRPPVPGDLPALTALAGTVARSKAHSPERSQERPSPGAADGVAAQPSRGPVPGTDGAGEGPTAAPIGDLGALSPPDGALPDRRSPSRKGLVASLLATAAVCVALAAVGLTVLHGGAKPTPGQATGPVRRPGDSTPSVVTQPSTPQAPTTTPTSVAPTTTTAPPEAAALVSTAAGTATYHISSTSDSIVVSAKGPCWLEVRADSPSGQVVYEGTLEAGQRSSVTGPAWIRLGDPPEVDVLVNGKRLGPPGAEVAAPLNLQFTVGSTA